MTRDEIRGLMGGYATGTLSEAERRILFEAALEDQELYDELAREQALKEAIEDPGARARLIAALQPSPAKTPWWLRGWVWGASVAACVVVIAGIVLVRSSVKVVEVARLEVPEPAAAAPAPAAAPERAQPVPKQSAAPASEVVRRDAAVAPPAPVVKQEALQGNAPAGLPQNVPPSAEEKKTDSLAPAQAKTEAAATDQIAVAGARQAAAAAAAPRTEATPLPVPAPPAAPISPAVPTPPAAATPPAVPTPQVAQGFAANGVIVGALTAPGPPPPPVKEAPAGVARGGGGGGGARAAGGRGGRGGGGGRGGAARAQPQADAATPARFAFDYSISPANVLRVTPHANGFLSVFVTASTQPQPIVQGQAMQAEMAAQVQLPADAGIATVVFSAQQQAGVAGAGAQPDPLSGTKTDPNPSPNSVLVATIPLRR